jgi:hypothetical protein
LYQAAQPGFSLRRYRISHRDNNIRDWIMKLTVLASGLLLAATGAVAAPPAEDSSPVEQATQSPTASSQVSEEQPAEEKKICRTERATGSLTRRTRVCMTAAQWREINAKTYKGVSEMQGSASGGQAVANNPGAGG